MIIKENFSKFKDNSRRNCTFSEFQEFSRTKVIFKDFSRSVRTLFNGGRISGPGCSKLTTSLVNVSLNFQKLISQICQYFLLKKCEKLLQCKSFSHFFKKKYQCIWF